MCVCGGGGGGVLYRTVNPVCRTMFYLASILRRCTLLLNEIQSSFSSTRRALCNPRPANAGLRKGAQHKLDSRDWIPLSSPVLGFKAYRCHSNQSSPISSLSAGPVLDNLL